MTKAAHHRGTYHRLSRALVTAAWANPHTQCWKCKRTINLIRHKNGKPARWTAGHRYPGVAGSPLENECSVCAAEEGGRLATAIQRARKQPPRRLTPTRTDNW